MRHQDSDRVKIKVYQLSCLNQLQLQACDNVTFCWCSHRSLGVVNDKLEMMSETNLLAGEIGEESQFEGITYR